MAKEYLRFTELVENLENAPEKFKLESDLDFFIAAGICQSMLTQSVPIKYRLWHVWSREVNMITVNLQKSSLQTGSLKKLIGDYYQKYISRLQKETAISRAIFSAVADYSISNRTATAEENLARSIGTASYQEKMDVERIKKKEKID